MYSDGQTVFRKRMHNRRPSNQSRSDASETVTEKPNPTPRWVYAAQGIIRVPQTVFIRRWTTFTVQGTSHRFDAEILSV